MYFALLQPWHNKKTVYVQLAYAVFFAFLAKDIMKTIRKFYKKYIYIILHYAILNEVSKT